MTDGVTKDGVATDGVTADASGGGPAGPPRGRRRLLTAVLLVAGIAGLVAVARNDAWSLVTRMADGWSLALLAVSVLTNVGGLLLGLLSWRAVLDDLGPPVGLFGSARIFFCGLLGKFLPTPVFGLLAHIQLGAEYGATAGRMVTTYVVSLGITMLTACLAALGIAPAVLGGNTWWLALPVLVLLCFVVRPGLIGAAVEHGARLFRRPPPSGRNSPRAVRVSLALALLSWFSAGLHLWLIVVALGGPPGRSLAACVGGFALATVAGTLTIVLPDGLGAREMVLVLSLSTVVPVSTAGAAAIVSRLVCTVAELGTAGVMILVTRSRRGTAPAAPGDTTADPPGGKTDAVPQPRS
ncbi:lysylphosphatidylglycerol synthase domain-containing protein [Kitasatospora sp. NPDC058184]|uniref:lysylphosphatidylglycerol synthase domain-containing protein n=1 Tax=Kitasatospora sp. NPDC058184 TaxID=3346370 RepID=UPI0036D9119A